MRSSIVSSPFVTGYGRAEASCASSSLVNASSAESMTVVSMAVEVSGASNRVRCLVEAMMRSADAMRMRETS